MNNPLKKLSIKEWCLWLFSLAVVMISNVVTGEIDLLTIAATWVVITSLIFAAKGNVWAQFLQTLNIVFSTISVTTSFLAAIENPVYIPVIINFMIFFMNDMYGFVGRKKREKLQYDL